MKTEDEYLLEIALSEQRLFLQRAGQVLFTTAVSTAAKGAGEQHGSECTPRGWHIIRAKIGAGCAAGTVFVGRRATGEVYHPAMANQERDWILSRILWLSGLEQGCNRLGVVDTMQRFIYIHGSPDEVPMGIPGSHGCIRMHSEDVIRLFDQVPVGTRVLIHD